MVKKYLLIICLILPLYACKEEASTDAKVDRNVVGVHDLSIVTSKGIVHKFDVELALTQEEQMKGLMHRKELAKGAGMLFFFNEPREQRFWMKNTLIPLDLLFIKSNGTIHHIAKQAVPGDLSPIFSNGKVISVLEINGGLSDELGLEKGDKVQHSFFKP